MKREDRAARRHGSARRTRRLRGAPLRELGAALAVAGALSPCAARQAAAAAPASSAPVVASTVAVPTPQAASPVPTPPKPWRDTAELNLTDATGNSRLTTFGTSDTYDYDWGRAGLELKGSALRSKSQGKTTAEQYNGLEKLRRKVKDDIYAYEKFEWYRDPLAGVIDRYSSAAGAGDELWTTPKDKLSGEIGGGYTDERRPDRVNTFATGRGYGKYVRALGPASFFSQDAEYIHDFRQARDYRLNTETALVSAISGHLSLKASYKWRRVGAPAPGFIKDDTTTALAIIVNY